MQPDRGNGIVVWGRLEALTPSCICLNQDRRTTLPITGMFDEFAVRTSHCDWRPFANQAEFEKSTNTSTLNVSA
jgi:hypothetical protein